MSEWLSVEEYNPPFELAVLGFIKHHHDIGASEIQVCFLDEFGDWTIEPTYEDTREMLSVFSLRAEVTHWQPLPSSPKD